MLQDHDMVICSTVSAAYLVVAKDKFQTILKMQHYVDENILVFTASFFIGYACLASSFSRPLQPVSISASASAASPSVLGAAAAP
jgi:hypothetical protein